jgi:hypothetical protein
LSPLLPHPHEAKTINQWREDYLRDSVERMDRGMYGIMKLESLGIGDVKWT